MNIGIDLGGSHIGVALIENGKILTKREEDIEKNTKDIKELIIEKICKYISQILSEKKITLEDIGTLGISSPGVAKDGNIYNIVNLGIDEFKITEMLNKKINYKNIKIMNDAKCAAIAEFNYGCMKNFEDGIFLTLGTGIGGAAFIKNTLIQSKNYPGTEFGHMVICKNGKECKCGNRGCFEKYCSMKALKEEVKEQYKLKEDVTSKEIIDLIKNDIKNEKMSKIIDNYIEYLAIGIVNLVNIFEPEVIGIGGSAVYIKEILIKRLKREIITNNILFNKRDDINIQIATLGNEAGMIGAASL